MSWYGIMVVLVKMTVTLDMFGDDNVTGSTQGTEKWFDQLRCFSEPRQVLHETGQEVGDDTAKSVCKVVPPPVINGL